ncbi:MAG: SdiA-regulated domain-containing protein [Bacteroidales bacterium]
MKFGYKLSAPDSIYVLPGALKEISGITERDDSSIVCVEDNREIIFIYDINDEKIIRQIEVGGKGDFEGVTRVDNTLYILRSDGLLSEIEDYESENYKKTTYSTGIPWKDNEGLCYDRENKKLLIGPKSIPGKKSDYRGLRFIYGFDLDSKELIKEPVFTYDLSVIEKFALDNNIKIPMKGKKKKKKKKKLKPDIKFHISALGIHPITGSLFVLSCRKDKCLFVFDMNGNIQYIEKLSRKLFRQPEGITFLKNGDMLISNEGGKKKPPTLLRFNYEPLE